jgi:hypothetical protein
MQLIDPRGQVVASWTIEQFLLVQKFMAGDGPPGKELFCMEVGQEQELTLNQLEKQLRQAHEIILISFQSIRHFDQAAQLHQAGLLIALLQDRLMRLKLVGFTPIRCVIVEAE